MAGPYEDPMQGRMSPPNPGGGGMPGQPRNPATGGYPSRDIAPSPLQPGQIQNPDLYGRSMQNRQWQRMMQGRMFPGMGGGVIGSPGMWGGGVDPGFNIGGAVPGQRPGQPIEPDMTSKADELRQYKNNLQFQKDYGITPYMPNQAPDWMSEDRAGRIAGRIAGRDPSPKYPGGMPTPTPRPDMPPWFGGPTGGLFGPPQWGRPGGYQPMQPGQMPGGGATPPGGAKPGGPAGQPYAQSPRQAQPGAQPEPGVYPA